MTELVEGELCFSFPAHLEVEFFDRRGRSFPHGVRPVDFIVSDGKTLYQIEVKDPSCSQVPESERAGFLKKMRTRELTHEELVPKARGTYTYLHLMERDDRPMVYVVVIGIERLSIQPLLLMQLRDRLAARLRREADEPWKRVYLSDCVVITPADLGKVIPGASVRRTTETGGPL